MLREGTNTFSSEENHSPEVHKTHKRKLKPIEKTEPIHEPNLNELYAKRVETNTKKSTDNVKYGLGAQPKYKSYTKANFRKLPQVQANFSEEEMFEMEVVASVLPFKTNNYVVEELIDWSNPKKDPIFILTFPQRDMLTDEHFYKMAEAIKSKDKKLIEDTALEIRLDLNPNPAGQSKVNIPVLDDKQINGMQHKYDQTALFFPSQGQTCHAYCTFCFRWPQFVNTGDTKFAQKEVGTIIQYLKAHPEITDLLITGGDPMIMSPRVFNTYIDEILDADIPNLQNIRIGTKSLAYWPYTYLTDNSADDLLGAFDKITKAGKHLSIMAHFNHYVEMTTPAVREAAKKIHATGARIRTQSPIFRRINDDPKVWENMWREQVKLGMVPYYMFIARDTGAQHYFSLPLVEAQEIFREAYQNVSGLARTVRGPSMSCDPGKIHVLGVSEVAGEKVIVLRFLQGRDKDWIHRPFFAKYDPEAVWIDDLKPAFGEDKFFYEEELGELYESITENSSIAVD